jgi:hypothetical protein
MRRKINHVRDLTNPQRRFGAQDEAATPEEHREGEG